VCQHAAAHQVELKSKQKTIERGSKYK
jgi:hypothetical protein